MSADIGKGPFTVGKPTQIHSNGEDYDVVDVLDSRGGNFATVFAQDCAGKDIPAAKARATRIAEALNRGDPVFGSEDKLPLHHYEERAGVTIGAQFVYPKPRSGR